jgi:hypothetical protein
MSIAPIIPLIGQLLTLSLKIADIIDKSNDLNVEDKAALKEVIQQAKDGVTYWEVESKESFLDIDAYRSVLAGLYSSGTMPAQEYKSNAQVIDAMRKAYLSGTKEDVKQYKDSIDRTLARYNKKVG